MLKRKIRNQSKCFCFLSFLLKAVEQKASAGLVDINSAGQKDLEGLKGVGPATAKKIIDGRPYKSVNDLSKAGLSAKAIESLKPFVTVGKAPVAVATPPAPAATTVKDATKPAKEVKKEVKPAAKSTSAAVPGVKVNINTADKAALDALPEIGPVKAQAIIDGRPYKTIEDVMKVSGIKEKTFEKIKDMITVR
jgi:competence protein ComEA